MDTNNVKEAIQRIAEKAFDNPKKYCRVFWYHDSKEIAIGNSRLDIVKAFLIYQDEGKRTFVDASKSDGQFILLCNPKKNMAFVEEDGNMNKRYKYFEFGESISEPENNNNEYFACVLETTSKSTILIAYLNGIYFLQAFDSEYSVTLFSVLKVLMEPNPSLGKEEIYNVEEKEEISERGFLEVL